MSLWCHGGDLRMLVVWDALVFLSCFFILFYFLLLRTSARVRVFLRVTFVYVKGSEAQFSEGCSESERYLCRYGRSTLCVETIRESPISQILNHLSS